MMYKVPMPTKANGVKLHTLPNEQIAIEYTKGELHVGPLASDSSCGIRTRNITFRRPDIDRIIAAAVRQVDAEDAMPPDTGISRSKGNMKPRNARDNDDDDDNYGNGEAVAAKVIAYLKDLVSPEDLEAIHALLQGGDEDDAAESDNDAGEPHRQATDRRTGRLAALNLTIKSRKWRLKLPAAVIARG